VSPTVEITHVQEFSASHRLHNPALPEDENRRIFGICNNLHGHGHNYVLEVSVVGAVPAETGMVMDLNVLSGIVSEHVVAHLDHKHLNHDVPFLEGMVTTAENLAVAVWRRLEPLLSEYPGCRLSKITVRESRMNSATYRGEATP
jgi:6-pyruvoyltetrahydropterin/6-carboxytetrahydropterin synthase